jgi:CBS domain-containing protein
MVPGTDAAAPTIPREASLRDALALMVEARASRLAVTDLQGVRIGLLPMDALVERHR